MRSALTTPTSPTTSWWDRPWLAVLAILALAFNVRPTAIAIGPVLQQVQADFAMGPSAAGVLTSLPALCFAFFGATAAVLAARFGPHQVTVAALVCVGIGSGARALVHDRVAFLALSVLALAGMAVANVLLPSLVKRHFPTRVSYLTALYS
ncbi:MAG: CynX/NimT family MFS transporter, partial [Propionibacteriaceae bacterium]